MEPVPAKKAYKIFVIENSEMKEVNEYLYRQNVREQIMDEFSDHFADLRKILDKIDSRGGQEEHDTKGYVKYGIAPRLREIIQKKSSFTWQEVLEQLNKEFDGTAEPKSIYGSAYQAMIKMEKEGWISKKKDGSYLNVRYEDPEEVEDEPSETLDDASQPSE